MAGSIINLTKDKIPFWDGNGNITVNVAGAALDQPLPPSDDDLAGINFGAAGGSQLSFGSPDNFKLGVKAGTSAALMPLWATSSAERLALLADYGLADYFNKHPDTLILALVLNAGASASAAGSFSYSFLTANASLDVGGQGGYAYLRPFPAATPVVQMLDGFFKGLTLPVSVTTPPVPGEVISFEYGGYLKVGAGLAIGYELKGTASGGGLNISELSLAEHYRLSVIGKLGLSAGVAGYFSVEVVAAEDSDGAVMPGWARVIVRKRRAKELTIAADVNVDASAEPDKMPDSGKEFLGAALGLNVKNWLNVMERVNQLADFDRIKNGVDKLAQRFIGELVGKTFDELSATESLTELLEKVQKVVESYQGLDNSAITLFDRYFDRLDFLSSKLDGLIALPSWDQLSGETDGELWEIVRQLTDGDPLGWILGEVKLPSTDGATGNIPTLMAFQARAQQALALIQADAHAEIRSVFKLAKESFQLDGFVNQLASVSTGAQLQALADQKLGDFVQRLIGKSIGQLASNDDLKNAVKGIQGTLAAINDFEDKLYGKFKEALAQSFSFDLHAQYSRASERDALVDVMINLQDEQGAPNNEGINLMQLAGRGDFQAVLAEYRPDLVRINSGLLSHTTRRESSFQINIAGWHNGFNYQGFDRVIVKTEQQITAEDNGGLTIYTTIDMTDEKERQRNGERMYTNFLLRFMGESTGVLKPDEKNQQYLIDTITGMAAKYDLSFENKKTRPKQLQHYLSFANEFGLGGLGATFDQLQPLLPTKAGDPNNFGHVTADYEVRYTEAGLRRLFAANFDEAAVRRIMRMIVLANYMGSDRLFNLGWGYWTQGIFNLWKQSPPAFTPPLGSGNRQFRPIQASPFPEFPEPDKIILTPSQLMMLAKLFAIEDGLVSGLKKLFTLIQSGTELAPADFEAALGDVGQALKRFDEMDEGVNTVFAVFDRLIQLQTPASEARASSLRLVSDVGTQQVTKMFIAQPTG